MLKPNRFARALGRVNEREKNRKSDEEMSKVVKPPQLFVTINKETNAKGKFLVLLEPHALGSVVNF